MMDAHAGPIILAGDFNTWSDARMNVVEQLAAGQGLQSVTFQHKQPAWHFGHQVDHIYYRGLTPLHSHVTRVESSDHYPLTVIFSLNTDL
jgi:endonuclease/exonuclease/phosphatase (EEP) superfamily protein YafD